MEFDTSKIEFSKVDKKKGLILPKMPSNELAEFIGILAGDGWVSFNNNQHKHVMAISGSERTDIPYFRNHVIPLINKLFNLEAPIHIKQENTCEVYFSSKGILNFLKQQGYCKHNHEPIKIPNWILNDDLYFQNFMKGLADTDFSLMFTKRKRKKDYPTVEITSIYNNLILKIDEWLKSKGFKTHLMLDNKRFNKKHNRTTYESVVRLPGHDNFKLWMDLINFRNPRHIDKIRNGAAGI